MPLPRSFDEREQYLANAVAVFGGPGHLSNFRCQPPLAVGREIEPNGSPAAGLGLQNNLAEAGARLLLDAYRRLHEDAPREHTQVKEACCHDDEYNQRRNFGQARHVSGPAHGKSPDKGFESADDRGRNLLL